MEGHLKMVESFHTQLMMQTDWLTAAERTCRCSLRRPSRLPDAVQAQLHKLKVGIMFCIFSCNCLVHVIGRMVNSYFGFKIN